MNGIVAKFYIIIKENSPKVKMRQMSEVYKKFLSGNTLVRKEIFSG